MYEEKEEGTLYDMQETLFLSLIVASQASPEGVNFL